MNVVKQGAPCAWNILAVDTSTDMLACALGRMEIDEAGSPCGLEMIASADQMCRRHANEQLVSVIDGMLKEAEKDKIKPKDEDELKRTLPQLRLQMKALVARDLWDMSEYFQVINTSNHIVMKAVERKSE